MSARMRKRALGDLPSATIRRKRLDESEDEEGGADDHEGEEDRAGILQGRGRAANFALLGDDSEDEGEEEDAEDEAEDESEEEEKESLAGAVSVTKERPPRPPKKDDEKPREELPAQAAVEAPPSSASLDLPTLLQRQGDALLAVNSLKSLNADAEALAIVGGGGAAATGRRQGLLVNAEQHWIPAPSKAAGGFSMFKTSAVSSSASSGTLFAAAADKWSALASSSAGSPNLPPPDSFLCFRLEFSDEWQEACVAFSHAAATGDPRAILNLLSAFPYHTDGLLALAEYHRATRSFEAANNLLRQAAFVFESGFHPSFRPNNPSAGMRLDRTDYRSRSASAVLTRLLKRMMLRAGTSAAPRAAMEIGKWLLQLSILSNSRAAGLSSAASFGGLRRWRRFEDSERVLLSIDYYALRAEQFQFVIGLTGPVALPAGHGSSSGPPASSPPALFTLEDSDVPVAFLPNLAFSRALAMFKLLSSSSAAAMAAQGARRPATADNKKPADTTASPASRDLLPAQDLALLHLQYRPSWRSPTVAADVSSAYSALPSPSLRYLVWALLLYPQAVLPLLRKNGLTERSKGVDILTSPSSAANTAASSPSVAVEWHRIFSHELFKGAEKELRRMEDEEEDDDEDEGEKYGDEEDDGNDAQERGGTSSDSELTRASRILSRLSDAPHPRRFGTTPELGKLIRAFVARHGGSAIWKQPDVLSWFFAGCLQAAKAFDAAMDSSSSSGGENSCSDPVPGFASAVEAAAAVNTAALLRAQLYRHQPARSSMSQRRPLPLWLSRYCCVNIAEELTDEVATLSMQEVDEEDRQQQERGRQHQQQRQAGEARGLWETLQSRFPVLFGPRIDHSNPLLAVLQAFLPWKAAATRRRHAAEAVDELA